MPKLHLTKSAIEALPPGAKLQHYTDDEVRGLTLIVTPGGAKTFYLVRKFRGRVERTKLGRFPETTVRQARTLAANLHHQYNEGVNVAEARRRERRELTLDQFFEIYFRDHCAARNKRPDYARYTYSHYIAPALGKKRLSELERADIHQWHRQLAADGRQRTANKAHTLLRAMLNRALAWEHLSGDNPATHVQRYREVARDRFMSPAELERFHRALAAEPSETLRDFFLVLLLTGARKSEALQMRWRDLDLESALWRVPEPKNREPRRVVLAGVVVGLLQRRAAAAADGAEWVFPGRRPGSHLKEVKRAWERLLDRAGIEDLRIHDLRRTLGSWMLAGGADLQTIGKALGHKDYQSTLVYARLNLDPVRASVEQVAARLAGSPSAIDNDQGLDTVVNIHPGLRSKEKGQ